MAKTGTEIIASCRVMLNVPADETNATLDAKLINLINRAFRDMKFALIRLREGYFLTYEYRDVTAGQNKVDVPDGMMNFKAVFYHDSARSIKRYLNKSEELGRRDRDTDYTSDEFREYIIEGDQIRLSAIPETSVSNGLIFLNTVALTTELVAADVIPINDDYIPCMEYRILELYAVSIRDWEMVRELKQLYYETKDDVRKVAWRRNDDIVEMISSMPDLL